MNEILANRSILVVEDEMMALMMIEDMLADLGCTSVASAAAVPQALALIDARNFDAAMLDINLGGSKSYPVADALALRNVPFFFATGYSITGIMEGYRDRPILNKPFEQAKLAEMFAQLFSGRPAAT